MSLVPPASVQKLRNSLHAKAKGSPGYRFYLLYDKLYRKDVLEDAYRCCKANHGAQAHKGQPNIEKRFEQIKAVHEIAQSFSKIPAGSKRSSPGISWHSWCKPSLNESCAWQ